ncbi:glycosyl hydrolase family 95 catalytic domain-containing protein [Actinoplanes siamensis]|uniref:Lectin n=1 Tax=Actinoplanes siamensis TaxID=1223317 RepID=A0A919N555_9ACTN|nr:RICIN domain-containing protein [Actinoplanes siamensis]GIF04609.1 lectin [Actinoplanes siamensis]
MSGVPERPLDRRRLLATAALSAGAAALRDGLLPARARAAVPAQVALPERGIYDTAAATAWTDGFLTGNGEYGAVLYGTPTLEKVIFNHHRFVLPNGSRDTLPPVTSGQLSRARDQALSGNYGAATATFVNGWSLRWTQTFHPGPELQISAPAMTTANNYARITDFRTGEVSHTWTDGSGTWQRRVFVSRADRVVVHELLPPAGQTLEVTLRVNTALEGAPNSVRYAVSATAAGNTGYLDVRGTYPSGGAYGFEGVTRAVADGGQAAVTASGSSLVVARAARLLLLTKLDRYDRAGGWDGQPLQAALAALPADYATLLSRHTPLHQAMYDRSRIDLNVPVADRQLSTSQLIARQNANTSAIDVALLERLYDSGRYLFVSSSGILPPRLTGIWTGTWNGSWADDFTTDANINLQVAGGNILDLGDAMQGYRTLILGQLAHWRDNANRLYGARGFLAPSRTDGEYGHMLHFDTGFPGHCWTGGADWLLYPLLEFYQTTGDTAFLRNQLGPALIELALFYEDFLARTDSAGKVVFVPSFSMENRPASTGQLLAINATGDIMAGRHALQAAIDAANTLGVEQGSGQGVQRWTSLLSRFPSYTVNGDGALAEWSWPGLTDNYNHRHVQHLYGAWPLHEINPEDRPDLVRVARRALDVRGDENYSAHGSLHRALARARLKDGAGVYANLLKILGRNMVWRSLMTSHNPNLDIYNADAANAIPAVLAEALLHTRPGILELLPALPDQIPRGTITGVRGRNRVLIQSLSWDTVARTATVTVTSAITQDITLICRRGIASISTTATVAASSLGEHARVVTLPAGSSVTIAVSFPGTSPTGTYRLVNRRSGKVLDVNGASTADGARVIQWAWTGGTNQQWIRVPNSDGSCRLRSVNSGKVLDSPSGSVQGAELDQATDTDSDTQWWKLVSASTSGYYRLVNVHNGWCADVSGGSTADGASVIQWPPTNGANQEWQLVGL